MIMDLSAPQGMSINDGIDSGLSSLSYSSIDQLAVLVVSEGKGSWLVKADIKEAYRMVPVHSEDPGADPEGGLWGLETPPSKRCLILK